MSTADQKTISTRCKHELQSLVNQQQVSKQLLFMKDEGGCEIEWLWER